MESKMPLLPPSEPPILRDLLKLPNTLSFPHEIRDVIPDLPTCGRTLVLATMDGKVQNTMEFGPRVQMQFVLKETGKLTGVFPVWLDIDIESARGLATALQTLADQAEKQTPVKATPPFNVKS